MALFGARGKLRTGKKRLNDSGHQIIGRKVRRWSREKETPLGKEKKEIWGRFSESEMSNSSQLSIKKGNWGPEEDELLFSWVREHGATKWTECSRIIRGRCGKQCRERWVNILNPSVKRGNWSPSEQLQVFESLQQFHTSWSAMSKVLIGRTENSIKNYFYSSVRRLKSNPVMTLLNDIYVSKRTSFEQVQQSNAFLDLEIGKLNRLFEEICRFLLRPSPDSLFKQFLLNVMFSNENPCDESSFRANSPIFSETTCLSGKSSEDTHAIFEMVLRIIEKSGNSSDPSTLIKAIESSVTKVCNVEPQKESLTLNIPYCWNCKIQKCCSNPFLSK